MREVSNQITITSSASVSDVKEHIERAFGINSYLDAADIRVEIEDGTVTLRGMAHSLSERDAAEWAAWATPGVRDVVNALTIAG